MPDPTFHTPEPYNEYLRECPFCNPAAELRAAGCDNCNQGWQALRTVTHTLKREVVSVVDDFRQRIRTRSRLQEYPDEYSEAWVPAPDYDLPRNGTGICTRCGKRTQVRKMYEGWACDECEPPDDDIPF